MTTLEMPKMTDALLAPRQVQPPEANPKRRRLYRLGETYNRWLVRWWTTRGMPGFEAEAKKAERLMNEARARMNNAHREGPAL